LPLDAEVTPANEADSPQAKPLLSVAKNKHPEISTDSSSMDAAYDSYENYRFTIEEIGAAHIIALNPKVRGLGNVKIHIYFALCAQIIKMIGATATGRLARPHTAPCLVRV